MKKKLKRKALKSRLVKKLIDKGTRKRGISEIVYKKVTWIAFWITKLCLENGRKLSKLSEIEMEITGITIDDSRGKIEKRESKG